MSSTAKKEPAKKEEPKQLQPAEQQAASPRSDENKSPQGSQSKINGQQLHNKKVREYFKAELGRVDEQLKKEAEKIQKPPERDFFPQVFNDLEPYIDLRTPRFVITMPDDLLHSQPGYKIRATAQGMTEPWVDLQMDVNKDFELKQQQQTSETSPQPKRDASPERKPPPRIRRDRTEILQGTILPRYPIVKVENPELGSRELTFQDVPSIREEVKTKYMACSKQKVDKDYKNTKEDFVKLELDRLAECRSKNQGPLRQAYYAYLENTPGSKKAIRDCMREFDKEHNIQPIEEEQERQKKAEEEEEEKKKQATAAANKAKHATPKIVSKSDNSKKSKTTAAENNNKKQAEDDGQQKPPQEDEQTNKKQEEADQSAQNQQSASSNGEQTGK